MTLAGALAIWTFVLAPLTLFAIHRLVIATLDYALRKHGITEREILADEWD